jgi:hypothetical protein
MTSQPENQPEQNSTTPALYPINEDLARRAKESYSFTDYVPGSATESYRAMVREVAELARQHKTRVDPMHHEKIDRYVDLYARKLADNLNRGHEIETRCPSVMIAGPSRFPVRRKEKQNEAARRNSAEFQDIQGIKQKILGIGTGGISADDPQALQKLEHKLGALQATQELMKKVNAWFRKNRTLDGCPLLEAEAIAALKHSMGTDWRVDPVPFADFELTNNNANIKRVEQRIAGLKKKEEGEFASWAFPGGKAEINLDENRLQLFFDDKPPQEQREVLKKNGFKWAPSQGAWQRQLTRNAIYACDRIGFIQPESGKTVMQSQPFVRRFGEGQS